MESKVIMHDASGAEVGETYSRRARQLVKQQRAVWADDTHTAIRFVPDTAEEWEAEPDPTAATHSSAIHAAPPSAKDKTGALYAMAERRIRDRNRLIWHTVALLPVFIIIFAWGYSTYNAVRSGELFLLFAGFLQGAWVMSYISRLRNYVKMSGYLPIPGSWEARRKMALDIEVDRLRRMGYTE